MSDRQPEKLIAPKVCRYCHEPFTPRKPEQMFCPKPARCAFAWQSRARKGQLPLAAIAARRRQDAATLQAALGTRFGVLSDRDREVYAYAHRIGYNAGFSKGYNAPWSPGRQRRAS